MLKEQNNFGSKMPEQMTPEPYILWRIDVSVRMRAIYEEHLPGN